MAVSFKATTSKPGVVGGTRVWRITRVDENESKALSLSLSASLSLSCRRRPIRSMAWIFSPLRRPISLPVGSFLLALGRVAEFYRGDHGRNLVIDEARFELNQFFFLSFFLHSLFLVLAYLSYGELYYLIK